MEEAKEVAMEEAKEAAMEVDTAAASHHPHMEHRNLQAVTELLSPHQATAHHVLRAAMDLHLAHMALLLHHLAMVLLLLLPAMEPQPLRLAMVPLLLLPATVPLLLLPVMEPQNLHLAMAHLLPSHRQATVLLQDHQRLATVFLLVLPLHMVPLSLPSLQARMEFPLHLAPMVHQHRLHHTVPQHHPHHTVPPLPPHHTELRRLRHHHMEHHLHRQPRMELHHRLMVPPHLHLLPLVTEAADSVVAGSVAAVLELVDLVAEVDLGAVLHLQVTVPLVHLQVLTVLHQVHTEPPVLEVHPAVTPREGQVDTLQEDIHQVDPVDIHLEAATLLGDQEGTLLEDQEGTLLGDQGGTLLVDPEVTLLVDRADTLLVDQEDTLQVDQEDILQVDILQVVPVGIRLVVILEGQVDIPLVAQATHRVEVILREDLEDTLAEVDFHQVVQTVAYQPLSAKAILLMVATCTRIGSY